MIVLLHHDDKRVVANSIASDLVVAFKGQISVQLNSASTPAPWPAEVNWDDLLIVIFDETHFPDAGNDYIAEYLNQRGNRALILPVALDSTHTRPPKAAEAIKALPFDATAEGNDGRLMKRVGAMIGLVVQKRDNNIFISYRAKDGSEIAKQLEAHLKSLGYPVWRDEARELDGETTILPGSDVQKQIDAALDTASIVLLADTPESPHSIWIKHEVDTANGLLLPVLPLCFRTKVDPKAGPRFRSLLDLQRWVDLPFSEPSSTPRLSPGDLDNIVRAMEDFLCDVFQRKCRVPFLVEKEFVSRAFTWRMLNQRLLISEAIKNHSARLATKVLSHCSIFDQVHGPALTRFCEFLKSTGRPNHSLYIYDGELIPEPQLQEIIEASPKDENIVILHHQELAALIESNFTALKI